MTRLVIYGRPQRWMRPAQHGKFRFTAKKPAAHKAMVRDMLKEKHRGDPWTCAVALRATFIFAIPKGVSQAVREACLAGRMPHTCDPDLDQLIKQVKDAASGVVYVDDNQVAQYLDPAKRYGEPERTEIEFIPIRQPEGLLMPTQKRLAARVAQAKADRGEASTKIANGKRSGRKAKRN